MNRERLQILRDVFAKVPETHVQMNHWATLKNVDDRFDPENACMTAACLAGWGTTIKAFKQDGFKLKYVKDCWDRPMPTYRKRIGYDAFAAFFDLGIEETVLLCDPETYKDPDVIYKKDVLKRLDELLTTGNIKE